MLSLEGKTVGPVDTEQGPLRLNFAGSLGAVCALFVLLLLICTEYPIDAVSPREVERFYVYLNHVLIMIFLGFGLLMTFLRRYSMSAVSLNFFASAMVFIEAILCIGACQQVFWGPEKSVITVDLPLLIDAAFCAGSAMIAFGAVIGKATPTQLLWMLFMQGASAPVESLKHTLYGPAQVPFSVLNQRLAARVFKALDTVPVYALNQHLVVKVFEALDMGGTIVIHAFGAYYGLAASAALSRRQRGYGVEHPRNCSSYVSDIFSMVTPASQKPARMVGDSAPWIGTLFLWINWPSFNGALASIIPPGEEENAAVVSAQFLAICNTLLSLLGSTLATFALSAFLDGKLGAVAVQNATLAGGVAMGAACTLRMNANAMLAGGVAMGAACTLHVNATLACGVAMGAACTLRMAPGVAFTSGLSAGAPGVAFTVGLSAGVLSTGGFKYVTPLLDARFGLGDTCGIHNLHGMPAVLGGLIAGLIALSEDGSYLLHSPAAQLGYQAAAVASAVAIGIASGYLAGWLVSTVNALGVPTQTADQMFEDALWWGGAQEASEEAAAPTPVKAAATASAAAAGGALLQRRSGAKDAVVTVSRDRSMDELIAAAAAPRSAC
ncbi:ammonium transporter family-domain-containing protein [Tribonema minus]|uniref:Ammonium transporter family-domain-containing protein n=1 Tax=Tribonema minus TaxID=303371 RepID=A0A835ZEV2_9STRA|nr:ammonium transporter family-domain-containing protein [Tribonema minus]